MVVVPAISPVTIPDVPTVPMAGLVLLQVPPAVISVSDVVEPAHTVGVPVMLPGAAGNELTVTTAVVAILPQPLVTV